MGAPNASILFHAYLQVLKIKKSAEFDGLSGQIINLMSNDVLKFDTAVSFIHDLWKGPIELFLFGFFIYREIGISGFIGISFMLGFIPLQSEYWNICKYLA